MNISQAPIQLVHVSELAREGVPTQSFIRAARTGEQTRVRRGVYTTTSVWDKATDRDKHLARMRAMVAISTAHPLAFSHRSAAAAWGIPTLGQLPVNVDMLAFDRRGVRSRNGVVWHRDAIDDNELCVIDGFLVTTFLRTLVDLARLTGFASAVVSLDHGTKQRLLLPDGTAASGVPRELVRERLDRDGPGRGVRAARAAIEFSNSLSGSPGESQSRVQMHRLRIRPPRLQVPVPRRDGAGNDIPDFDWDEAYGEFDGKIKYTREQYTGGRPIEEIVWDEKQREDRLRRAGKKDMARWLWNDATHSEKLLPILLDAGLVPLSDAQYRRECAVVSR